MSPLFDRLRSRTAALAHDLATIPVAWLLAYWLRFNLGTIPPDFLEGALVALPLVMLVQGAVYWRFGLYRGVWRFASLPDLTRIAKAVFAGTALTLFALFVFNRIGPGPALGAGAVPRFCNWCCWPGRACSTAGSRIIGLNLGSGQRVLIVGAGQAGEMLVRDMLRDPRRAYLPVAFVDDRLRRQGGEVHGVPVRWGRPQEIPALVGVAGHRSDPARHPERLGAGDAAPGRPVRGQRQALPHRPAPAEPDDRSGRYHQLRPVAIEDLLGRDPVTLDWDGIRAGLAGRVILVTGAGGSIGSELCRQIAGAGPGRLILVDNGEFNLYRIEMELRPGPPRAGLSAAACWT